MSYVTNSTEYKSKVVSLLVLHECLRHRRHFLWTSENW